MGEEDISFAHHCLNYASVS